LSHFRNAKSISAARTARAIGITEMACEVIIDGFIDAYAVGIDEDGVVPFRFADAVMECPKHRLGHAGKAGRYPIIMLACTRLDADRDWSLRGCYPCMVVCKDSKIFVIC
jgi:hypothetical protein